MGKYFKYAIGEIILVMIGILLALQVNNWNQKRLNKITEKEILNDLKIEFQANYTDLNRVTEQHKVLIEEFTEIQRITQNKDYGNKSLDSLMFSTTKWFTFTQRLGASKNLINSGNLNLISNKTLRDLITNWSGIADDVIDDETFCNDFTKDVFVPFLAKHYPYTNMEKTNYNFFKKVAKNKKLIIPPIIESKEVDWKKLLNKNEFQSLLSLRKLYELYTADECLIALSNCAKIIELINKELQHD